MTNIFYDNYSIINKFKSVLRGVDTASEEGMQLSINSMINCILYNSEEVSHINGYSKIVSLLGNLIDFCNSDDYNYKSFEYQYEYIKKVFIDFTEEVENFYSIRVVFSSDYVRDTYSLLFKDEYIYSEKGMYTIFIYDYEYDGVHLDKYYMTINIEELLREVIANTYDSNYEQIVRRKWFEFLKSDKNTKSILSTGSSYSWFGLNTSVMEMAVNDISNCGQDMYYSYKIADSILTENSSVEGLVISTMYYNFHYDMSVARDSYIKYLLRTILYPLLHDAHNSVDNMDMDVKIRVSLLPLYENKIRQLFNLDKVEDYVIECINSDSNCLDYQSFKQYCNDKNVGLKKFETLTEQEKEDLIIDTAKKHSKKINYVETESEYIDIFEKILKISNEKGIEPVFVIYPMRELYRKNFNQELKNIFYKNFNMFKDKYIYHIIDMYDDSDFDDNDFLDAHHLNFIGAEKASKKVDDFLKQVYNN